MKDESGDPSINCDTCKFNDRPSECSSLPWEREWWPCDECGGDFSEFERKELNG